MSDTPNFKRFSRDYPGRAPKALKFLSQCLEDDFEATVGFILKKRITSNRQSFNFWNSDFPVDNLKPLFRSVYGLRILQGYFFSDQNVNTKLLALLAQEFPKLLIQTIKFTRAFDKEAHYKSFLSFKPINSDFYRFYSEITFLRKYYIGLKVKRKFYDGIIMKYPIESILIQYVSYWEKIKRTNTANINNILGRVSTEIQLYWVFEKILSLKKELCKANDLEITPQMPLDEIRRRAKNEMPPLNPGKGIIERRYIPEEEMSEKKRLLRETFVFYKTEEYYEDVIKRYLAGQMEFEIIDGDSAILHLNDTYVKWRLNDKQFHYEENYWHVSVAKDAAKNHFDWDAFDPYDRETEFTVQGIRYYLDHLHLPHEYKLESGEVIQLEDAFRVLKFLSQYCMPEGRFFQTEPQKDGSQKIVGMYQRKKEGKLKHLIQPDYFLVFPKTELKEILMKGFQFEAGYCEALFKFLTTDLSDLSNPRVKIGHKPFLQLGDNIFWLSPLLRDRKWANHIKSKVTAEENYAGLVPMEADKSERPSHRIEKALVEYFKKAGFPIVKSGVPFNKNVPYKEGDIDCMVYDKGHLFLMEIKSTYVSEDPTRICQHRNILFEHAADQLEKASKFIDNQWVTFSQKHGIQEALEDIAIHRYIVVNVPYLDYELIRTGIRKLNLLELIIILTNTWKDIRVMGKEFMKLMMAKEMEKLPPNMKDQSPMTEFEGIDVPIEMLEFFNNRNSPFFRPSKGDFEKDEDYSLWSDPERLHTEELLEIIKSRKVWGFIPKTWNFSLFKKGDQEIKKWG